MGEIELKPCAHCGGKARKVFPVDFACIECSDCRVQTNLYDNMNNAIAAWNTRSPDTVTVSREDVEVKGPYKHSGDLHPHIAVHYGYTLPVCVFFNEGDERRAFETADWLADRLRSLAKGE